MKTMWTRILALMTCVMLLMTLAPTALAEWTTLEVDFYGLIAQADGQWRMETLTGSFTVQQDGKELGVITADGKGSNLVTLQSTSNALLVPDMATMPEGYLIQASGYSASVTAGRLNSAMVMAYANAGLFTLQAEGQSSFVLVNEAGETVLSLSTDRAGRYTLPEAIPAGIYTVRQEQAPTGNNPWPDFTLTLEAYRGLPGQIVQVDSAYAHSNSLLPVVITPEPTEEPTAEPTAEPTPEPTEEPTAEPTAEPTPEPTEEPTAEPTAEPTPEPTEEPTAEPTAEPTPEPTEEPTAEPTAEPTLEPTEEPTAEPTAEPTPTPEPTEEPTAEPTAEPTPEPTEELTAEPTVEPTPEPTEEPTAEPTVEPTPEPTEEPTAEPTAEPTPEPTEEPTAEPTAEPTPEPTEEPTAEPTAEPTPEPTEEPVQVLDLASYEGPKGSLKVWVYNDRDNNGERGTYDMGVENVTLTILTADGGMMAASAVTDGEGILTFENLPAGQYVIHAEVPAGIGFSKPGDNGRPSASNIMEYTTETTQISPVVEVTADDEKVVAIGTAKMAAVSGKAWNDINGDGIMQEDEPGQEGVLISLAGVHNGLVYEFVTGEDGLFYIGQVKPGNYKMTVTTPEGTMFTKYTKQGGSLRSYYTTEGKRTDSRAFELKAEQVFDQRYIGVVGDGTVEALCFLDANFNGFYDEGEAMLPGVEVDVLKAANGKTVGRAVSDENGVASVGALRTGEYSVHALLPKGYTYTCVVEGGNQFDSRNGRREYTVKGISVEVGKKTTVLIGTVMPGSVTGVAYLDDNFSGTMDAGEEVVSGLIIALLDQNGEQLAVDRTTVKGKYVFEGLNPGTYTMRLEAKHGYAFTKLGEGNYFVNIGEGRGQTEAFTVALGQQITGMDIGQILPGTVQGSVFADANDNGVQDNGETGFAGTVVRLMDENGEQFAATIGEDGAFVFDAVMPGRYFLRYELPGESTFAQTVQGGNTIAGIGNVGDGSWFDFAVGSTVNAPLCGGLELGRVSGITFADHNGSGVQEEGEAPLSGVTLTLTPSRGDLQEQTTVTTDDGSFAIGGLHPDTYTLTLTYPEGYVASRMDSVTLPVQPGVNSQSTALPLAMGDTWLDQPLGGVKPASLSGAAWLDENNDGRCDASEVKPAGETVTVIDQHNGQVFAVLTIGEDGSFATEGLIPGSYTVQHGPAVEIKAGDSTFAYENGQMVMHDVQLTEGEERGDLLLGIVRHTTIGGQVWVDQGGEVAALAGAEMVLLDASGAQLATTTSDEAGAYVFGGLMPGQYKVKVNLPEGQVVVEPGDERLESGENTSAMIQCDGRQGESDVIDLKMAKNRTDVNVGGVLPGTLGDLCWLDENGNGLQDSGEGGIPGVKIELLRGEEVVAETISDQYGFYRFENVYPASYTLRVTAPQQVQPTQQRTDFPLVASVLNADGTTGKIAVVSDKNNLNADLGFVLVKKGEYPAGYGQGATQDWTKLVLGDD